VRPDRRALTAILLVAAACRTAAPPTPATRAPEPVPEDERGSIAVPPLDLPAPLPPPAAAPAPADATDPYEVLWGHHLDFAQGGEPLVNIRIMEGQEAIAFRARGPAVIRPRGGTPVEVPAGARILVRAEDGHPSRLGYHALVAEGPAADRDRLDEVRRLYADRGVSLVLRRVGDVHGIAGRVIDNRRELLLVEGDGSEAGARADIERLRAKFGARAQMNVEVAERPRARLVLVGESGAPIGEAASVVVAEAEEGFVVEGVQHDLGPVARSREDRAYRGRIYLVVDAGGHVAAVHGVPLEELLLGLVPSEMPASSPLEALKAQAVTARSNVLAQLGTRHLSDPYMLCAEVHCQAYRGDGARTPRTDQAVRETRGEALFGQRDRTVVDAVYSAMCGGHGEDNDKVWGTAPNPSLRGHPDLPASERGRWDRALSDEGRLRAFLAPGQPEAEQAFCRRPVGRRDRFRWEQRYSADDMDRAVAALGVGHVTSLTVTSRGVSGRARVLRVEGARGTAEVSGELAIRRALRHPQAQGKDGLPSAMFVVDRDGEGFVLRGGGWGHGAGMCQWGAVGRAEAGQGYREILRAYFSGAEVGALY